MIIIVEFSSKNILKKVKTLPDKESLEKLLHLLNPRMCKDEFVFCSFNGTDFSKYAYLSPEAAIIEDEGISLVVSKEKAAKYGLKYDTIFKKITLAVHSSLDAVGLTAAVSGKLAEKGIPANMIAGFHHDHIFVPLQRAEEALGVLSKIKAGDS